MLCAQASRAITNYAPIGEYQLRFFPREEFDYPCGDYPIETRQHILHECQRFNNYWNSRRNTITYFMLSNLTQVLFCLNNHFLLVLLIVLLYWFDFLLFCLFIFSLSPFLFFFLLFLLFFLFHVASVWMYIVTK